MNNLGETPLHGAARWYLPISEAVVTILLSKQANIPMPEIIRAGLYYILLQATVIDRLLIYSCKPERMSIRETNLARHRFTLLYNQI